MQISTDFQSLAIDPRTVSSIDPNLAPAERLTKASEQFEAIFLQLVLKSMHTATDAISGGEGGLFGSREMQHYREMHDSQLAQHLASTKQLGLAEAIVRQLGEGLSEAENKFKQLAEAVALPEQGALALVSNSAEQQATPATYYINQGLSQPLWAASSDGADKS